MKTKYACFSLLLALLACAIPAVASVPSVINYQGRLMQPSGAPVADGTYSMLFSIYDAPSGGTLQWSETNPSVQVKGGLFATMLGSVTSIPASIFDSPTRYFAVKVGSDAEMTPRQQIASSAFAFKAATVDDGAITATKLAPGVATPPGVLQAYVGTTAPTGWLLCDGSAVSTTTYAALFAVMGYTYGGSGATFDLPNLQDKFPMGKSGTKALGTTGGAATVNLSHTHTTANHTLTVAEMPNHSHAFDGLGCARSAAQANSSIACEGGGTRLNVVLGTGGGGAHSHGDTGSAGSSSQSIINPYQVVNYIIKI